PSAISAAATDVKIKDQVDVTVEIPGKVNQLNPSFVGGRVEKDDLVISLISDTVEAELAELELQALSEVLVEYAKAKLAVAEKKLTDKEAQNKKSMDEFDQPVYTAEEIDLLKLEVLEAKAELAKSNQDKEAAKLKFKTKQTEVKQYTVFAPIDGVVTNLHSKANGSGVRQGDPIMTIVNLAEVTAKLKIARKHESTVTIGDKVLVRRTGGVQQAAPSGLGGVIKTSQPNPAEPVIEADEILFEGEIVFIIPDQETHAFLEVEAVVQNKFVNRKYLLRQGTEVEAKIIPMSQDR
ncbi:MAG: HlyD family efflux transporter periplasmic adaptor subunit, partial [Fuerstiella sp.]